MKEKRDIITVASEQVHHLDKILDIKDVEEFRKLIPELKDTWVKKQIFRTETEMRISVLNDGRHPTKAAKYWQCVREQNVFFENLMDLSFDARKNDVEIKQQQKELEEEKDELKKELIQIELDQKYYRRANLELTAKDRMREIEHWSRIKKELDDGSFDTRNVNTHQAKALTGFLEHRRESLSKESASDDVFNVLSQLNTIDRLKKEGKINDNEKALPNDQNNPKLSK
tara:strand:+ start:285 stop:968 length:684 start_codon:yes stop_codon:yes gene_type:complete